jgi:hypothetical protein
MAAASPRTRTIKRDRRCARRQTLPGDDRNTTRVGEKIRRANMQSANHLALIRSILIDSGLATASHAHFFVKYFYVVHEANPNAKKSRRSRFARSVFRPTDIRS